MASVMLVCAVLASLAFGVLVAHGLCMTMFRIFNVHSQAAARVRESHAVRARIAVEG